MSKIRVILLIIIIASLSMAGIVGYWYLSLNSAYSKMQKEAESEAEMISGNMLNQVVIIKVGDKTSIRKYADVADVDYTITYPEWQDCLTEDYIISYDRSVSQKLVLDWLDTLYEAPTDAELVYIEGVGWNILPEENSYNFDMDAACSLMTNQLKESAGTFDLNDTVKSADVTTESLKEDLSKLEWMNDFVLSYGGVELLTGDDLYSHITDFEVNIESLDLSDVHKKLSDMYDTYGLSLTFTNSYGDTLTVPYVTYGESVAWTKEKEVILNAIKDHKSLIQERPLMNGYADWSKEYIEVSITNQYVWHYVGGELCCDTNCVTGTKGTHDTPTGVYYITERIPGKYLIGSDYKTWVNQWMRLTNSGIGLHDAYWRGKFGGSIYTYNGSHGCINLPAKYAENLFNEVRNGVAVIVY